MAILHLHLCSIHPLVSAFFLLISFPGFRIVLIPSFTLPYLNRGKPDAPDMFQLSKTENSHQSNKSLPPSLPLLFSVIFPRSRPRPLISSRPSRFQSTRRGPFSKHSITPRPPFLLLTCHLIENSIPYRPTTVLTPHPASRAPVAVFTAKETGTYPKSHPCLLHVVGNGYANLGSRL